MGKKINLPQITKTDCLEMTEFDFRKGRGKMWIRYQENSDYPRMYPDLHSDDLLLVDFEDRELRKGYLFLLYLPNHDQCPFVVRQVKQHDCESIEVTDHSVFPLNFFDLSKEPSPILGRIVCSVRNWAYRG